jgi:hypothetical protein
MGEDEVIAAKVLQRTGKSFSEIAKILGVHVNTIRAELDTDYFAMCHRNMAKLRERKMNAAFYSAKKRHLADTRDHTAVICGDPIYERSALYQVQQRRDPLALRRPA